MKYIKLFGLLIYSLVTGKPVLPGQAPEPRKETDDGGRKEKG